MRLWTLFHGCRRTLPQVARNSKAPFSSFVFSEENFRDPKLPSGLHVLDVPLTLATEESLRGYGHIIQSRDERTVENQNFEIVKWPALGHRQLDPGTGDEAGTVEGEFRVYWENNKYFGENLAVSTTNNVYLDGLGGKPEDIVGSTDTNHIYLWMSDYHPDGAQMFWSESNVPFVVCLGESKYGDDIKPEFMRAFYVPKGVGVYIHPGTWHNGVYVSQTNSPSLFLTRQGRVHARISASWATEFNTLLRVPLSLES
eukprot:m.310430 g.310430  ORF g.310430 m.310430 type:complete len:256 (-) comp16476_c2_seq12:3284-4051(-)